MEKRLYKDHSNKKICGVCSGIAKYFNLDPTVIRVGWILLASFGPGILAYFVCAAVIPDEPGYIED